MSAGAVGLQPLSSHRRMLTRPYLVVQPDHLSSTCSGCFGCMITCRMLSSRNQMRAPVMIMGPRHASGAACQSACGARLPKSCCLSSSLGSSHAAPWAPRAPGHMTFVYLHAWPMQQACFLLMQPSGQIRQYYNVLVAVQPQSAARNTMLPPSGIRTSAGMRRAGLAMPAAASNCQNSAYGRQVSATPVTNFVLFLINRETR